MNLFSFNMSYLLFVIIHLQADLVFAQDYDISAQDAVSNYRPSLPVVIGLLCFMFILTVALLLYAKFCSRRTYGSASQQIQPGLITISESRFSGIDKTVIESLPFFRFSSLKGSKEGLECAVCLSKFEDIEILRLLPKCRHAFHIRCIDQWLEKHSTCPLCRQKVSVEDSKLFTYSGSFRFPGNQSDQKADSNIELFVQREEEEHQGSARFSIGGSFRKIEKLFKQEETLMQESGEDRSDDQKVLDKFNHKIVMSDVLFKNRWSSVSSSDLAFLNSDMFNTKSSNRFLDLGSDNGKLTSFSPTKNDEIMKIKEEMERKVLFESRIFAINKSIRDMPSTSSNTNIEKNSAQLSRYVNQGDKRSMSELTGLSRYEDLAMMNKLRVSSLPENNAKNERLRQLWLPIARRTVRWFANKERRSQAAQNTTQPVDV